MTFQSNAEHELVDRIQAGKEKKFHVFCLIQELSLIQASH